MKLRIFLSAFLLASCEQVFGQREIVVYQNHAGVTENVLPNAHGQLLPTVSVPANTPVTVDYGKPFVKVAGHAKNVDYDYEVQEPESKPIKNLQDQIDVRIIEFPGSSTPIEERNWVAQNNLRPATIRELLFFADSNTKALEEGPICSLAPELGTWQDMLPCAALKNFRMNTIVIGVSFPGLYMHKAKIASIQGHGGSVDQEEPRRILVVKVHDHHR